MATLPLSTYIDKSVTHIKINRIDGQGNDNTLSLQELDSIRIITQDPDFPEYFDFAITSISEFPTYYLYEISPSTQPLAAYGTDTILNSDDSNIPDCTFYAERTTPLTIAPNSVDGTGGEITGYNIIYTSSPNTFNSSTGIYTVGITPNIYTTTTASITIQSSQGGSIRLAIVDANTGETAAISSQLSTPFGSSVVRTFSSSFPLSGSIVENLLETTQYRVDVIGDGSGQSYTISNFSWTITQSIAAKSSPASNTVILEPYLYDVFEYSDCNVLINNATEPQYDSDFFKVNYDTGQSIPTNQTQILQGTAERAPVNPSNYTTRAQIYPRYNGVKTTAPDFNTSSINGTGYGGLVVAGNPAPFVGYYNSKGGSTPEVLKKTIINLDYIIDENISTQVPALSDFTIDTQKGLYPRGGYLYLDPDKNSTGQQFAGNNVYKIYRSGEYATPILYSQTGSDAGFIETLTFAPPGEQPVSPYFNGKYSINQTSNTLKQALYNRPTNSPAGIYGYNNFTYNSSYGGVNDNPIDSALSFPALNGGGRSLQYPHTWNQIPLYTNQIIYQEDGLNITSAYPIPNNPLDSPYNRGRITLDDPITYPNYSFKVRFTITIKWAPPLFSTNPNIAGSVNYGIDQALYSGYNIPNNSIPLKVGFRIRGTATGWDFLDLTPEPGTLGGPPYEYIQKGQTKTITIETPVISPGTIGDGGYIFVQGIAFLGDNDYLDVTITGGSDFDFENTSNARLGVYNQGTIITNPTLEIIQVPEPNTIDINYTPSTPYITSVFNSLDFITSEGNSSLAFIQFTSSFAQVLGKIYPQVSSSGYDSTIYPFEFPNNYQLDNLTAFFWLANGASQFGATPPPLGTFDYEIRFNADENQAYSIVGYYYNEDNSNFGLIILRPIGAILTSDTADGPVPIDNYQSFLIRRWIPRAGYIYLDVDADLGKGIVKPQFITDGIQAKIPQIVKELTDKGLIT